MKKLLLLLMILLAAFIACGDDTDPTGNDDDDSAGPTSYNIKYEVTMSGVGTCTANIAYTEASGGTTGPISPALPWETTFTVDNTTRTYTIAANGLNPTTNGVIITANIYKDNVLVDTASVTSTLLTPGIYWFAGSANPVCSIP